MFDYVLDLKPTMPKLWQLRKHLVKELVLFRPDLVSRELAGEEILLVLRNREQLIPKKLKRLHLVLSVKG